MSIFKRLFGKISKPKDIKQPKDIDIEKLLVSEDINGSIIELDNFLGELCSYGNDLDKLTEQQKNFYFNQNLEREINNGGFNQFFFNSAGDFAHETVNSLAVVGANKTAEILKKAIAQFPDHKVPSDRNNRQEILSQIEEDAKDIWEELDQKFFIYEDNLNDLNLEYVRKNKDKF